MTQMKEGCCSAISPCAHQQRDPTTICDVCARATRATAAEARVAELEKALEEIADPLSVWRLRAEVEGQRLSGLAYQIANNPQTLKDIARAALGRQP